MRKQHCRLIGIDTPEPHTETKAAGDAATKRLLELVESAAILLVRTHFDRKGSFRRLLIELWADGVNVNDQLVDEGFARKI
jgi:endonuclease YncB( thermonuclease family)